MLDVGRAVHRWLLQYVVRLQYDNASEGLRPLRPLAEVLGLIPMGVGKWDEADPGRL